MTDTLFPIEPTCDKAQEAIVEMFALLDDWSERYQFVMDLGQQLPDFPETWKVEDHRLQGCQSQVWIVPKGPAQCIDLYGTSDSAIVRGLVYLVLRIYSGRCAREIVATPAWFLDKIGFASHLSSTRSQGLFSMISFVQSYAKRQLELADTAPKTG